MSSSRIFFFLLLDFCTHCCLSDNNDATCPTTITRTTSTLIEKEKVLIMTFIDLGKAYDNVCRRNCAWRMLVEYGVTGKLLRSMKALYDRRRKGQSELRLIEGME